MEPGLVLTVPLTLLVLLVRTVLSTSPAWPARGTAVAAGARAWAAPPG